MKLRFLGHAAVLLTSRDETGLLVDPYNPGGFGGRMAYRPIPHRADAVVCSHQHLDHCAIEQLPNRPQLLEGDADFGPFSIRRYVADHDEYGGRRRGGQVDLLEIEADGTTLVHLSDVGHSPRPEQVAALRGCDVLVVPVGGYFTIGAAQAVEWCQRLAPGVIVPVHYRTDRCELPLRDASGFAAHFEQVFRDQGSCVELKSPMISFEGSVVVLQPAC